MTNKTYNYKYMTQTVSNGCDCCEPEELGWYENTDSESQWSRETYCYVDAVTDFLWYHFDADEHESVLTDIVEMLGIEVNIYRE